MSKEFPLLTPYAPTLTARNHNILSKTIDATTERKSSLNNQRGGISPLRLNIPRISDGKSDDEIGRLRNQIFTTVRRLQTKLLIPHNASKKRNLELIRKRRGSDYLKKQPQTVRSGKSISLSRQDILQRHINGEISLNEKMRPSEISGCSLEEVAFYG